MHVGDVNIAVILVIERLLINTHSCMFKGRDMYILQVPC